MNIAALEESLHRYIMENYGRVDNTSNLEYDCDNSSSCWKDYKKYSYGGEWLQKPYVPFIGPNYEGLLLVGVNLNGGNDCINCLKLLKCKAVKDYLKKGKYLIFREGGYRGSPVWYYIPLLGFLYSEYAHYHKTYTDEKYLSPLQISDGFNYCAVTNLIKCSTCHPSRRSTPDSKMFINCARKLKGELHQLAPKIVISFTLSSFPNLPEYIGKPSEILHKERRTRISKVDEFVLLELLHPLSTKITRGEKFEEYSAGLYRSVDYIRKYG